MRKIFLFCLLLPVLSFGQNLWPKSFPSPKVLNHSIIEDIDGGYLAIATFYADNYSYLLKFDANANLLWRKCLFYKITSYVSLYHLIKDKFKNLYIVGNFSDVNPQNQVAFILKLDSCYHEVKCLAYEDSTTSRQQYFASNIDLNDSSFFLSGSGFNLFSNQCFVVNKSNLSPQKIYNTMASFYGSNDYKQNNSIYIPGYDYSQLNNGDTSVVGLRTCLLKLDKNGDEVFYKFFGFDKNIISDGYNIFKNARNNLYVFSIFRSIVNDTSNLEFSPMLFECDTNGIMLNYKIYKDDSVNQIFSKALQFNDSIYIMATTYLNLGVSNRAEAEKIKFYKLNGKGEVVDSFYVNNWGSKLFTSDNVVGLNLIKTYDNKIMCVFLQRDSNINNTRITFLKFDENFKLDTTEYRNKSYDASCGTILNDSIDLKDATIYYLDADSTYPVLKLSKPLGIIAVPEEYKYSFYPNPIKTNAIFELENLNEGELRIVLVDIKGSIVKEIYFDKKALLGQNRIKLNFEGISSGQYYMNVYLNGEVRHTIKVIKE